jgi:hypothetical protein
MNTTPSPEELEVYREANLMYENGLITRNEALIKVGLNSVPSGDKFVCKKNKLTNIQFLNND